jgi:GTP-binding protein LepA
VHFPFKSIIGQIYDPYSHFRIHFSHHLIIYLIPLGHVDFAYEVSRSLASCQGALLLVDSTQSVQAQTLQTHQKAKDLQLKIVPVATKIDLPSAQPEETALIMATSFDLNPDDVIMTSAKTNTGVDKLLEAIVDEVPSPTKYMAPWSGHELLARIIDSWYDQHRGVVCLIQIIQGKLREADRITTYASATSYTSEAGTTADFSVQECGVLSPLQLRTQVLDSGQVGYMIAGMKSNRQARVGDTIYIPSQWHGKYQDLTPLEGYESTKCMLYASIYPEDPLQLEALYAAVARLSLNDASVTFTRESMPAVGSGMRCGFLGFLHMEVFSQRLQNEFDIPVVMTSPSVPYEAQFTDKHGNETFRVISSIADWPDQSEGKNCIIREPMVNTIIVSPLDYYGALVELIKDKRGVNISIKTLDDGQMVISSMLPWQEVVRNMNDQVKQISSGYASLDYSDAGYHKSSLVKVDILVNGEKCPPLSFINHTKSAPDVGRKTALRLKQLLKRQQFEIIIQAKIGQKVLVRERLAPYRKDVLIKSGKTVGGGDISRKKKLLQKQKEGKKRSKMVGQVEISQEAFWSVMKE